MKKIHLTLRADEFADPEKVLDMVMEKLSEVPRLTGARGEVGFSGKPLFRNFENEREYTRRYNSDSDCVGALPREKAESVGPVLDMAAAMENFIRDHVQRFMEETS